MIGECSASCGTGTRTNTRDKSVVEANGGTCTGPRTEIEECNPNPCPSKKNYNTKYKFKKDNLLNGDVLPTLNEFSFDYFTCS